MGTNQQALMAAASGPTDSSFASVVFLGHFDGTNGSTTLVNSCPRGTTMAAHGTAALTTTSPQFGTASLAVTGATTSFADSGTSADYTIGTGDFTLELSVNTASPSQVGWVMSGNNNDIGFLLSSGTFSFRVGGSAVMGGGTVLTSTWQAIAVSRTGAVNKLFVNGVQVDTINSAFNCTMDTFSLGVRGATFPGVCHIDELRLTKGVGRYTGNYTPAAAAFPDA